jgi:hypothetical protein
VCDMPAQARTPVAISQMSTPKAYTSAAAGKWEAAMSAAWCSLLLLCTTCLDVAGRCARVMCVPFDSLPSVSSSGGTAAQQRALGLGGSQLRHRACALEGHYAMTQGTGKHVAGTHCGLRCRMRPSSGGSGSSGSLTARSQQPAVVHEVLAWAGRHLLRVHQMVTLAGT